MTGRVGWPVGLGDDVMVANADRKRVLAERRYQADAWTWVRECVTTVDELDPQNPIKPFPVGVCVRCQRYLGHPDGGRCPTCGRPEQSLTYLAALARQWQSASPSLLIVPKARRMRLTWLFVSLHVWLAWTQRKANIFFVSSKEEKSAELVERATGIVARWPVDKLGPIKVQHRNSPPELRFLENGSKIVGVPEGPDQLRQFTATAVFADELGTYESPRACFSAMKPTIDGGGRLTILSSAYPGFYRELVAGEALG